MVEPPVETDPEESAAEPVEAAAWTRSPEPQVEPERPAARNGGAHGASPLDASHKSLEDSVKDMLRPMLRQWLDENMPRMVTSALKDELGERRARGQGE
jgi:cell pole-organizing protein PopZ